MTSNVHGRADFYTDIFASQGFPRYTTCMYVPSVFERSVSETIGSQRCLIQRLAKSIQKCGDTNIMQKCSSNIITSYNIHCILFRFQTVLIALKIYLLRIQYTVIASLLWNVSNRSRYSNHTFVDDIHMIKHDFAEKVIHIKYLEIIVRMDDFSIQCQRRENYKKFGRKEQSKERAR